MSTPPPPAAPASTPAAQGTVVTDPPKPAAPAAPANGAPATPAPAAAPQGGQPPAAGKPPQDPPKPGELKLVLPEGSHLDTGALERIAADAKARNLTQEQAEDLLKREDAAVATYVKGQNDAYAAEQKAWVESLKADKELGGAAFDESVALAKRAVDTFGTEAFKKALNETGLGNHPELVRVFARIGRNMADDKLVRAGAGPAPKKSPEQVFYPETPSKEA